MVQKNRYNYKNNRKGYRCKKYKSMMKINRIFQKKQRKIKNKRINKMNRMIINKIRKRIRIKKKKKKKQVSKLIQKFKKVLVNY